MNDETMSRRKLLRSSLVLGLAGGGAAALPVADAAMARGTLPDLSDPAVSLRQMVRMQGSLEEEDVPWWFTGVIFGVVGEEQPRPLFRFEGLEIYWFRHDGEDFILGGNTVTFFRDYETSAFLYEYANPYTGERNEVKPAVQGGGLGFRYSARGIWPVKLTGEPIGPVSDRPLKTQWHAMRDKVWMQHQTVYPPGMPPMHGQRQTMFAERADMLNPRLAALPSVFTSVVFMRWFKWMNMGDRPGHLVWHASGAKLRDVGELPEEYRRRAEKEFPERMTARTAAMPAAGGPPGANHERH